MPAPSWRELRSGGGEGAFGMNRGVTRGVFENELVRFGNGEFAGVGRGQSLEGIGGSKPIHRATRRRG